MHKKSPSSPKKWGGGFPVLWVLLTALAVIHGVAAFLYFRQHGLRSSFGGDIWYFICVARGWEHLALGDPLQWILPLFHSLKAETLFDGLMASSFLLHLVGAGMLFGILRETYEDSRAAAWAVAAWSCSMTALQFTTASFQHQQVQLPILLGFVGWMIRLGKKNGKSTGNFVVGGILLLLGFSMGPDLVVPLAAVIPIFLIKRMKPSRADMVLVLSAWALLLYFGGGMIRPVFDHLAWMVRGIQLTAQHSLNVEDLAPFGWNEFLQAYGWGGVVLLVVLAGEAFYRKWFAECLVLVTTVVFGLQAARFHYLTEMVLAVLVCRLLATWAHQIKAFWIHLAGEGLVMGLLVLALSRGMACYYPGSLLEVLKPLQAETEPRKVLCTPTYGFLVHGWTGHSPTSDWHHLDDEWIRMVSGPEPGALVKLKQKGVTHLFLTTMDLALLPSQGEEGEGMLFSSGGFEKYLPEAMEDIQQTLAFRAFYAMTPPAGTERMAAGKSRDGHIWAVLVKVE